MGPTYGGKIIGPNDSRHHNVRTLLDALDLCLRLFAGSRPEDERLSNLAEVLKRGARFGYMLFMQPTEWTFQWTRPSERSKLVVHPALLQTVDDEGRPRSVPQRFGGEAHVVSVS
jgi:hypothetical protein